MVLDRFAGGGLGSVGRVRFGLGCGAAGSRVWVDVFPRFGGGVEIGLTPSFHGWSWVWRGWLWARVGRGVLGEEAARLNTFKMLEGAQVATQARLSGPFIREPIGALVALDADVGGDPLNVDVSVLECAVIKFAHSAHECTVGIGAIAFGYRNGCVRCR